MTIDIARKFEQDLAYIDVDALPMFATFCLYQATLLHVRLADEAFLSSEWCSDLESLKVTLAYFARRWPVAGKSCCSENCLI